MRCTAVLQRDGSKTQLERMYRLSHLCATVLVIVPAAAVRKFVLTNASQVISEGERSTQLLGLADLAARSGKPKPTEHSGS
jgi:hypothetical protein